MKAIFSEIFMPMTQKANADAGNARDAAQIKQMQSLLQAQKPKTDLATLRKALTEKTKKQHIGELETIIASVKKGKQSGEAGLGTLGQYQEYREQMRSQFKAMILISDYTVPLLENEIKLLGGEVEDEKEGDNSVNQDAPGINYGQIGSPLTDESMQYWSDAAAYALFGDYSGVKPNLGGIGGSILAGLFGVDTPRDVADFVYGIQHWEWDWDHAVDQFFNTVGIVPAVGIIKNVWHDSKYADLVVDETKVIIKNSSPKPFLTAEEFANLPKTGTIDPNKIRFSQDSIKSEIAGTQSLDGFVQDLKSGLATSGDLGPIRVVEKDGAFYTLDNRTLYAYQQAGVNVHYVKVDGPVPLGEDFKFTTTNGGASVQVRGKR